MNVVVGRARRSLLASILREKVEQGVKIETECLATYRVLSDHDRRPAIAEYRPDTYQAYLNYRSTIGKFWSFANRAISTTYRHVDRRYLWKYLKEFEFRFNRRDRSEETYWDMVSTFPLFSDANLLSAMRANDKLQAV